MRLKIHLFSQRENWHLIMIIEKGRPDGLFRYIFNKLLTFYAINNPVKV